MPRSMICPLCKENTIPGGRVEFLKAEQKIKDDIVLRCIECQKRSEMKKVLRQSQSKPTRATNTGWQRETNDHIPSDVSNLL